MTTSKNTEIDTKFTYAKYLKATLDGDYLTLAKNHQKIDGFYDLWSDRYLKCAKIIRSETFFDFVGTDDDFFARWLAFRNNDQLDEFLSHPKTNETKLLFELFLKDPKGEISCYDIQIFYEFHLEEKMDDYELGDDNDWGKAIDFYLESNKSYLQALSKNTS